MDGIRTSTVTGRKNIKTYFLNKKFDTRNPLYCADCPNPNCLHTVKSTISFPREMTVCMRTQPMRFQGPLDPWSFPMSFGNLADDWSDMEDGFVYANYKTGPWIGFKHSGSVSYEWVGIGKTEGFYLQVWARKLILES